jgi:hypothetical protein
MEGWQESSRERISRHIIEGSEYRCGVKRTLPVNLKILAGIAGDLMQLPNRSAFIVLGCK